MAAPHASARWAIFQRLYIALDKFESKSTQGLQFTIENGRAKTDTLWGDGTVTNPEWRKFKVKAADREKAFVAWARPQVEHMVREVQVHAAVWSNVTVHACIHYFTGEIEIDVQVHNPKMFDRMVASSQLQWNLKPRSCQ